MIVTFTSHNKAVKAAAGENLLDIISRAGIILDGSCGGNGNCGCCKVQIVGGRICALTPREKILLGAEEIAGQYRLACHVRIDDDLQVKIPRSRQTDNRKSRLNCLPSHFYLPPGDRKQGLGIAFDVGTTTVAGLLWDMGKAELLDAVALTNPQSIYGADVISRINFCGEAPANLGIMQKKIIDCCNHILHILLAKQQRAATEITEAVMVGNSTMSHIFLGISPASLAALPFLPAFSGPQNVTAAALGLG
ncbi:MAG: 2Fe-2S iron-sulfur cluster-binding protein, partial [Clostridiales bacterium]|nr:2Fe-2S iron-sulfur cluster-binding protein [Clostridiales bacterium]